MEDIIISRELFPENPSEESLVYRSINLWKITDISVDKIATVYFAQTARIYTKIIQKWMKRLRFCVLLLLILLLLLLPLPPLFITFIQGIYIYTECI